MNRVMLIGRLTAKPELRYTGSNVPYSRFSIAVNRTFSNSQGERETDFFNVVVWRKQAENVCNFMNKGSLVAVEGRLQQSSYNDKDGNKRTTIDVVADNVQFLETKGQSSSQGASAEPTPYDYQDATPNNVNIENDPFGDLGDSITIDDNFLD